MWRQTVVQDWISNGKFTAHHSNSDESGDSKTFVATIVANVATERMRLDTTEIEQTRPALDRFHDSSKVNGLCYILELKAILRTACCCQKASSF